MSVKMSGADESSTNEKHLDSSDFSQSNVNRESVLCTWSHLRKFFECNSNDNKNGKKRNSQMLWLSTLMVLPMVWKLTAQKISKKLQKFQKITGFLYDH